jgi:hypothetical protein
MPKLNRTLLLELFLTVLIVIYLGVKWEQAGTVGTNFLSLLACELVWVMYTDLIKNKT